MSAKDESSFPWDKMDSGAHGEDTENDDEQQLNGDEQLLLEQFMKQASDLGIDLTDPHVKEMLRALGNVEGEIDDEKIDEIMYEQELERNLHTAEVIIDGIEESTFATMLNNRIKGDDASLKRLMGKTSEELKIMLVEAMARDIPTLEPDKTQNDHEEAILHTILDLYGLFTLKVPKEAKGKSASSYGLDLVWIRSWGLPGLCLFLVLGYTAFMYYHYPEMYTDYAAFELKRKAAMEQSRNRRLDREEL